MLTAATLHRSLAVVGTLLSGVVDLAARADNPIIQTLFTADPAPLVWNNTVYLFADHDESGATTYTMKDWRLYTSTDMTNWRDHGVVMSLQTFSWARADAWAGQVVARNNKFYFYASMSRQGGGYAIGVGVSDTITGPYRDALGKPLLSNSKIDPTVFIDEDDQAYMYWGNPGLDFVRLNKDMISHSGGINSVQVSNANFQGMAEGPWLYKRNGTYIHLYAASCCPENIRYVTGPSATGPWTYRGIIMDTQGASFTNHPAIINYKGGDYFFYHNGALPGGSGYQRSIAIEKFEYGPNSAIPNMRMTTAGAPQIGSLDPYVRVEAETMAFSSGLMPATSNDGGIHVAGISPNDYIKVKGVDFGAAGPASVNLRVAGGGNGAKVELRLGSTSGTVIATCTIDSTGGTTTWKTVTCPITGSATGKQDLFFKFAGNGSTGLFLFNWWQFTAKA